MSVPAGGQTSSSNVNPEVSELDNCSDARQAVSGVCRYTSWAVRAPQSHGDTCGLRHGVMLFRLRFLTKAVREADGSLLCTTLLLQQAVLWDGRADGAAIYLLT